MNSSGKMSGVTSKEEFLNKAHEARQARELSRKQEHAATTIQAHMRSYHVRRKLRLKILNQLDQCISSSTQIDTTELHHRLRSVIILYKGSKTHYATIDSFLRSMTTFSMSDYSNQEPLKASDMLYQIICDCAKSNKSIMDWLSVFEYLINYSLDNICAISTSSSQLGTQDLALYMGFVNRLISIDCYAERAETVEKLFLSKTDLASLRELTSDLAMRTMIRRKQVFLGLSETMGKTLKGPKTQHKTSISSHYIEFAIQLIKIKLEETCSQRINSLSLRANQASLQAEVLTSLMSVPVLMQHISENATRSLISKLINEIDLLPLSLKSIATNDYVLQDLTSTPALCILANLIQLASLSLDKLEQELINFAVTVIKLLEICNRNTKQKGSMCSNQKKKVVDSTDESYNHILGWLTRETAPALDQDTSRLLKNQFSQIWSLKMLKILFNDLTKTNEKYAQDLAQSKASKHQQNSGKSITTSSSNQRRPSDHQLGGQQAQSNSIGSLRRALERAASTMGKTITTSYVKSTSFQSGILTSGNSRLTSTAAKRTAMVCLMFNTALKTLRMIKQDILTGLCLHEYILRNLWMFITSLGPHSGMKAFLDHLTMHTKSDAPEFHILMLFCECASHLINILDDSELYEQQKPFTIDDLILISQFLNTFVFRILTQQLVCYNSLDSGNAMDPILKSTHNLLMVLYKRDCRRKFTPKDHWLMNKDMKMSAFLRDLEQGKPVAGALLKLLPHIIPHKERVLIFRRQIAKDKAQCSGFSTFITIHRSRLVEDGYQQIARLPPNALKGSIRVKFINDHGLDEAGIDQDGVFKEFLEDTIKRVFDPALNLFSSTSEQRLYPSPTSRLHEDHLSLFNFVGKMLAKAVYEGIVVDVPFATFFLSRVLGQPQSVLYSPIDELPSLDPELYNSLTYIKHYEGDVSHLDLTFSLDQDFMGKLETYDLEPGGKFIPVTNETRVRYIHSVANFRMKTQIEEQTEAFVRGFKSIVNLEWLSMFSASEFQRLISGDTAPIDLQDLRKNTKYFGGFHNSHRVICWLWDILEKDFTPEEHSLFLKFVTSCSKPPLLGFANLEPPFSIRCVEVSDDQDSGDTVGSVLRGFFAIRRSDPVDRLPTSSTCFNLLKLPNYQRRSTLLEKLRYATQGSTGFELS